MTDGPGGSDPDRGFFVSARDPADCKIVASSHMGLRVPLLERVGFRHHHAFLDLERARHAAELITDRTSNPSMPLP